MKGWFIILNILQILISGIIFAGVSAVLLFDDSKSATAILLCVVFGTILASSFMSLFKRTHLAIIISEFAFGLSFIVFGLLAWLLLPSEDSLANPNPSDFGSKLGDFLVMVGIPGLGVSLIMSAAIMLTWRKRRRTISTETHFD